MDTERTPCALQGSRVRGRGAPPPESRSRGADRRRAWASELSECCSALPSGPLCARVSVVLRSGPPWRELRTVRPPGAQVSEPVAGGAEPSEAAALPSRQGFLGVVEALGGGLCGPRSLMARERASFLGRHRGSPTPQPLGVGAAQDPSAQCQPHPLQGGRWPQRASTALRGGAWGRRGIPRAGILPLRTSPLWV